MLTVLNPRNPDGGGSRAHAPEAMHTPGLTFTGGDNATHTSLWKKLAWALCTGRGFFLLGKWLRLHFFLVATGYQGSVCVHVCACVCVCVCV